MWTAYCYVMNENVSLHFPRLFRCYAISNVLRSYERINIKMMSSLFLCSLQSSYKRRPLAREQSLGIDCLQRRDKIWRRKALIFWMRRSYNFKRSLLEFWDTIKDQIHNHYGIQIMLTAERCLTLHVTRIYTRWGRMSMGKIRW